MDGHMYIVKVTHFLSSVRQRWISTNLAIQVTHTFTMLLCIEYKNRLRVAPVIIPMCHVLCTECLPCTGRYTLAVCVHSWDSKLVGPGNGLQRRQYSLKCLYSYYCQPTCSSLISTYMYMYLNVHVCSLPISTTLTLHHRYMYMYIML